MIKIYQQNFIPASRGLIKSAPSSLIPDGSFQETVNVRFGDGYVEKVQAFVKFSKVPEKVIKINLYRKNNGNNLNMIHTRHGLYNIDKIDYNSWKSGTEYNEDDISQNINADIVVPVGQIGFYCYKCIQGGTSGSTEPEWVEDTTTQIVDGTCIWIGVEKYPNLINNNSYEVPELGHVCGLTAFDQYLFTSLGTDIYYWDSDESKAKILEGTYSPPTWAGSHSYAVGAIIKPTNQNYSGYIYKCTKAGTSGSSEPTWQENLSTTITDGTAKWVGVGSFELEGNSAKTLRAQSLEVYKGFLFVANTEEDGTLYPYRVRWSQFQNPRLWHNNEDDSGMAGYVDVDDTYGKIIAIKKLGDALYIYKERSIIAFTYTGGEDTVFSKEVITTKAGLISPEAIIELPHMHIFIGQDNVYIFDGNTCTPIGDPVKDWVYQYIKPDSTNKLFGYYNEETGDATFSFYSTDVTHTQDNCDKAIIYNVSQRVWSTREMFMTAIGQYSIREDRVIDNINVPYNEMKNYMIDSSLYLRDKIVSAIGDEDGNIYFLSGYSDSRRDYEGYVISKTHHMDAPDRIKRLMRIQFHIETSGDYNLYCQVGTGWNAETNKNKIEWTEKQYMNLEEPNPWYNHHIAPFVDVDLSARYFQIRFGTENNGEPFKILGYTLYYQLRSDE